MSRRVRWSLLQEEGPARISPSIFVGEGIPIGIGESGKSWDYHFLAASLRIAGATETKTIVFLNSSLAFELI